ncbi:MAG TPA: glycosyltransferase [Clostridiales bacterium]|nr:glycosyltransferase [Clostridiales bacterium]
MKILYVTTVSGTINAFLLPHIELLLDMGHRVDIACNGLSELSPQVFLLGLKAFNIEFERNPLSLNNYYAYKRISKLIAAGKYDIVHVHTPVAAFLTRLACRKIPYVKVVYTAHGFHFYKGAPMKNRLLFYSMERLAARWTDALITMNSEDYIAARKMKLRGGKVFLINGVGMNLTRFSPQRDEIKIRLRKAYGYRKSDFILLFAAELNHNKHQDLLIDTAKLLSDRGRSIILLLAGEGEKGRDYRKRVSDLNLEDKVKLLGRRNDVPNLLQIADIAVSSSRREGLPVFVMEAMASGLPVVATGCRGNRDLIVHNQNGYLVEDNAEDFAAAIEALYQSPELRKRFGEQNHKLAGKYAIENILPELKKIYSGLEVNGGKSRETGDKGRGSFVLSLDTELAWGSFDLGISDLERKHLHNTRSCIRRLLGLLEKYQISATFAFVGHLMLDECSSEQGMKHKGLVRPNYSWYQKDWFSEDPAANIREEPIWYGRDILCSIRSAQPKHEIACHSFSHIILGDPGCSAQCAEADISECVKTAEDLGVCLSSFVFPRNSEGYKSILRKYGIRIYRGSGNEWYKSIKTGILRRVCHILDEFFCISPKTSIPYMDEHGLLNTQGNMLYLSRTGIRRFIPIINRVLKAKKGIDRAIKRGEVFHMWFHPCNLASDADGLLRGLEEIFTYAREKIDSGLLENCTMEGIYRKYTDSIDTTG